MATVTSQRAAQSSRMEQHRTNFETLKGEFLSLQRQHDELKDEYESLSHNYLMVAEKSEEVIKRLQDERDLKILECEQLKSEMLSPSRIVDLKEAIATEVENMYRKQLESLETEISVLRSEHKKISKNYNFLQSEHESVQAEYSDKLKETKIRLQKEISVYKERCKQLSVRLENDIPNEVRKVRHLQKENTELSERNCGLETENEQLRSQLDTRDAARDQQLFALNQEISELKLTLEQSSNEVTSLHSQNKHLHSELEALVQSKQTLTKQLIEHQREVEIWKRKHEDLIHENAREIDTINRKNVDELQQHQEDRRRFNEELEQHQIESETRELIVKQLETAISEKDKEMSEAVEKAIETEWQRRVEVEKDKMALEGKLSDLQREVLIQSKEHERTVSELRDNIKSLKADKIRLETDLQSLQAELQQKNVVCSQSSKDLLELKDIREKISTLTHKKTRLEESERQLEEENESLVNRNQLLTQQVQSVQSELDQFNIAHHNELDKTRKEIEEERSSWKSRLEDMTSYKNRLEEKLSQVKKKKSKLQKEHDRSIREVERLLEVAHESEKQALLEKDKLRKSANEEVQSLKAQLKAVRKRHHQFMMLIGTSPEVHYNKISDFKAAHEIDTGDLLSIASSDKL